MQASLQLLSNRKRDLLPGQRENDGQREQDDVIQQDRVSTGLALNTHSSVEALRVLPKNIETALSRYILNRIRI